VVAVGTSTDDGTKIWVRAGDDPARVVDAHREDAGVGALSEDETLLPALDGVASVRYDKHSAPSGRSC
jgi:hypothetical protein